MYSLLAVVNAAKLSLTWKLPENTDLDVITLKHIANEKNSSVSLQCILLTSPGATQLQHENITLQTSIFWNHLKACSITDPSYLPRKQQ